MTVPLKEKFKLIDDTVLAFIEKHRDLGWAGLQKMAGDSNTPPELQQTINVFIEGATATIAEALAQVRSAYGVVAYQRKSGQRLKQTLRHAEAEVALAETAVTRLEIRVGHLKQELDHQIQKRPKDAVFLMDSKANIVQPYALYKHEQAKRKKSGEELDAKAAAMSRVCSAQSDEHFHTLLNELANIDHVVKEEVEKAEDEAGSALSMADLKHFVSQRLDDVLTDQALLEEAVKTAHNETAGLRDAKMRLDEAEKTEGHVRAARYNLEKVTAQLQDAEKEKLRTQRRTQVCHKRHEAFVNGAVRAAEEKATAAQHHYDNIPFVRDVQASL